MGLKEYRRKRDFAKTPEPAGDERVLTSGRSYLIQKHAASRLHYDLRLELDGVLKSWAVPKGPSLDPANKHLAVHVEDHPLEYGGFEGVIPEGEYGGGTVMLWDRGTWEPLGDAEEGYRTGKLKFRLHGERLKGGWMLARMGGRRDEDGKNWLLFKERDEAARPAAAGDITEEADTSVVSGRSMEQIAAERDRVWSSAKGEQARPRVDPAALPAARTAAPPAELAPQLATLVKKAPSGDAWLHEVKFDGYRMLARLAGGEVRLLSRNGLDWTSRLPTVAAALGRLGVEAILDGEVVMLGRNGASEFQLLQNAMKGGGERDVLYYVFDLPYLDGHDLRHASLVERKRLLRELLGEARGTVRFSDHIEGEGPAVLANACALGLEGIVSKRADSRYDGRRSGAWLKIKCVRRQELVIGGWSEPEGARAAFGSLLVGVHDATGRLRFAGRVGTGFSDRTLRELLARLREIERTTPPFSDPPRGAAARGVHWVEPRLVAEVEFLAWTRDGQLRHPSFQGLREDRDPREVVREEPRELAEATGAAQLEPEEASGRKGRAAAKRPEPEAAPAARRARTANARGAGGGQGAAAPSSGSTRPPAGGGARAAGKAEKAPAPRRSARGAHGAEVEIAGVRVSNPDKVLYPEMGLTKLELVRYWEAIAHLALPHVAGRPLALVRCPHGHEGFCFFQKHLGDSPPERHLEGVAIEQSDGVKTYIVAPDLPALVALVQLGVLELHPWGSRATDLEHPDRLIFDLDPGPGLDWEAVVAAAVEVRDRLTDLGLKSWVKTSGGKGLHVVVPIRPTLGWDQARAFTESVAVAMAREAPRRYTASMSKARRAGRVFVDYLRNARNATAVATFSTRARPGAPVSTPITWDELADLSGADAFTVRTLPDRLATQRTDPWKGFLTSRQTVKL